MLSQLIARIKSLSILMTSLTLSKKEFASTINYFAHIMAAYLILNQAALKMVQPF